MRTPPYLKDSPVGSCIYIYTEIDGKSTIKVLKQLTSKDVMAGKKEKETLLPYPLAEIQVGSQLQLSLIKSDGNSAYSSASSWLIMKAVPDKPFTTQEELDYAVEALGDVADGLIKRRVKAQADTVHLHAIGTEKSDAKLDQDDLFGSGLEEDDDDSDLLDDDDLL